MNKKTNISLDKISKEMPFTVPENYFENFALQFENKIATPKTVHLRKTKSWMIAAAVFAGVILAGTSYYSKLQSDKKTYSENYESYVLSQVDESAMLDYYLTENNTTQINNGK